MLFSLDALRRCDTNPCVYSVTSRALWFLPTSRTRRETQVMCQIYSSQTNKSSLPRVTEVPHSYTCIYIILKQATIQYLFLAKLFYVSVKISECSINFFTHDLQFFIFCKITNKITIKINL